MDNGSLSLSCEKPRYYEHVNLLTKRKHQMDRCELCESVAGLVCLGCKVTFYCSVEHFALDRDFHAVICSRVKDLRTPMEFSPQAETRDRWRKQRLIKTEELYKFCWTSGQAHLEEGKYDSAIPAATVSIKYANDLFGQSPEVVPPLLIAAESYVHKGKLTVADGFLARAMNIESSCANIRPSIKAWIRRNEGLIHLARNKLSRALGCFAEEIYQSTEEFGPYHIRTSGGYCRLGHVFYLLGNFAISSSLYRQTVDIWIKHMEPILEQMTTQSPVHAIASALKIEETVWMQDNDKFEGTRLLTKCHSRQLETSGDYVTQIDHAKTCYALGVVHYINERYADAKAKAVEGITRLADQDLSKSPVYTQLHNLVKFTDRKLFQMEKATTIHSSESDMSSSIPESKRPST